MGACVRVRTSVNSCVWVLRLSRFLLLNNGKTDAMLTALCSSGVTLALHQTRASRGHGRAVPALLGIAVLDSLLRTFCL